MTNVWFHAFTITTMSAHSKQVTFASSRQGRRAAAMVGAAAMFLLLLLAPRSLAVAQELDSSVLQKEAEQEAAAKTVKPAKQAQQPPASQNQPPAASSQGQPQASNAQGQPKSAQPQAIQPQIIQPQANQPGEPSFMLPPGTKLPLGLLRPLKLKTGRDIYLQITFPVTVGNQMVIPPGTYVQGVVGKIIRKDRRRYRLEFEVHSANMIFLNGYTVPIAGTVNLATTNAALQAPPRGNGNGKPTAAAMAAVGGSTAPSLPPDPFAKDVHNAMIVIGVVGAVAVTTAIVLAARSDPYVEAGTPLEIVLPAPLFLDAERVMAAVQQAGYAPVQIVQPPVKPRICYDPGSPGTPDTVIPGSPGTPDTVIPGVNGMPDTIIPGSPRTPDTVIPGTPGTPSSSYPCPR